MDDYDLIVVGLGIYGASVAEEAASRGLSVLGLDQYDLPHSNGSSHGGSRIFRYTTVESEHYIPLARRAADLWAEINEAGSGSICASTGFALISPQGAGQQTHHGVDNIIERALDTARRHGIDHESLTGSEFMARHPAFHVGINDSVFFEPGGFVIQPEKAIKALLRSAKSYGATIQAPAHVSDVSAESPRPSVLVGGRSITARHIVLCTGPWRQKELLSQNVVDAVVGPQVTISVEMVDAELDYSHPAPAFVQLGLDASLTYGILPAGPIREAKVSVEQSKLSIDAPNSSFLPKGFIADQERLARLSARSLIPSINFDRGLPNLCYYTTTWNSQLVVERTPEHPHVTIVSACSGHGFKYAPAIAELVIDNLELPTYSLADSLRSASS